MFYKQNIDIHFPDTVASVSITEHVLKSMLNSTSEAVELFLQPLNLVNFVRAKSL